MKRVIATLLLCGLMSGALRAQNESPAVAPEPGASTFWSGLREAIHRNLGRPYVWGAAGLRSFDCSGFVWRVLTENGLFMKRTTARKLYLMMKPASKEEQGNFGTLIFFDDLKHIGIVDTPDAFYHAQSSKGTNRSAMNAYWKQKIYGYRRIPAPGT